MTFIESHMVDEFTLDIFYNNETRKFHITVSNKEHSLEDEITAIYEPIFGIDVSDYEAIYHKAELLCEKIEGFN